MGRDKVVIIVVVTVIFSAILFGILMAYRTYYLPMQVESIDETIDMFKNTTYSSDRDEEYRMYILYEYNHLARSCKMMDSSTGEIRKFTKEEMEEFYNAIGGKEAVIKYLSNIEDREEKREKLEYACYTLKVITSEDLAEIWGQ